MCVRACAFAFAFAFAFACVYVCVRVCVRACMHVHVHACVRVRACGGTGAFSQSVPAPDTGLAMSSQQSRMPDAVTGNDRV